MFEPARTIHLRIRVTDNTRQLLLDFLQESIPFYEEPGGIRIRLLEDAADPNRFIEIIEYETEAAYEQDQVRVEQDPQMKSRLEQWRGLLGEPPVVEHYRNRTPNGPA